MNIDRFRNFSKFVDKEILPATQDLEKLDDANRKHVQKLVYTNLVDRFDSMIDGAILDNCREAALVEEAGKRLNKCWKIMDIILGHKKPTVLRDMQIAVLKKIPGQHEATVRGVLRELIASKHLEIVE